jgi:hypothetical protein
MPFSFQTDLRVKPVEAKEEFVPFAHLSMDILTRTVEQPSDRISSAPELTKPQEFHFSTSARVRPVSGVLSREERELEELKQLSNFKVPE